MLEHLAGKASNRKSRLFACACCRRLASLLLPAECFSLIEVAERYADGLADEEERLAAVQVAVAASMDYPDYRAAVVAWEACATCPDAADAAEATTAAHASVVDEYGYFGAANAEYAVVCALFRDIFGNPFRPVAADPRWLSWKDGTVVKLAQSIYNERNFASLPILADALEDAGCTNEDILNHCRQLGEHVRGCWVVDLLLGKE
jgi:hypothetical protein